MKSNIFFLAVWCIIASASSPAYAVYFTVQLKNGNTIKAENYWDDGSCARFFTREGFIVLPDSLIKDIAKNDGVLGSESVLFESEAEEAFLDEEGADEVAAPGTLPASEMRQDLSDRLNVIASNIRNLNINRETYLQRRERYVRDATRADERIEALRNDSYITSGDLKERTELEQSKLLDAEQKISGIDAQIKSTEDMLQNQERMKSRLESELANL